MELTSREYKLMLRTDRFSGAESDCRKAVASFWQAAYQSGFRALFSRSVDARLEKREEVATIGDLLQPFSGLSRLSLPSDDAPVVEVGALRLVEHVYEGGALRLPADVEAESAMIVWWREGEAQSPVAAEFSFRFALEKGAAEVDVAERAWRALSVLHGSDWAVPDGTTKTALVYGGGGG